MPRRTTPRRTTRSLDDLLYDNEDVEKEEHLPEFLVSEFTSALRKSLLEDKKRNNCLKFLFEEYGNDIKIETLKSYFECLLPIGLLAIKRVINKHYEMVETYIDTWDDSEPGSEVDIPVAFQEEETVIECGIIELINKETKNKLTLKIATETSKPYFKVYSSNGNNECKLFIKKVKKAFKSEDIYKNKTFVLEKYYNLGLVPKFIKEVEFDTSSIILPPHIIEEVHSNIINIISKSEEYKKEGIPTKRGVLLEGPPGAGKTTLLKYINALLQGKATFIYITDGVIEQSKDIGDIFDFAREYQPTVLDFEDIDIIGAARESYKSNFTAELLGQLDGLEILNEFAIVATTNHPDMIDDALKNRPNRFDRRLKIELPDADGRFKLLSLFLKNIKLDLTTDEILNIVNNTKNFSGAILKELIITAQIQSFKDKTPITVNSVLDAISYIKEQYYDSPIRNQKQVGLRNRE